MSCRNVRVERIVNSPSAPTFAPGVIVGLTILACISLGCSVVPPTNHTEVNVTSVVPDSGFRLTDIVPTRGLPGDVLRIRGAAFSAGAVVTIGGIASTVIARTGAELTALAPFLAPGVVEIAVTNPSGERRTLAGGFTVEAVAISASPSTVTTGDPLSVSYDAPNLRLQADWVGLFRFGDLNENYLWFAYTSGVSQRTITIPAPSPPGDYEFRYLASDGYIDAARTGVVRVIPAGADPLGTALSGRPATRLPDFPLIRPSRGRGK